MLWLPHCTAMHKFRPNALLATSVFDFPLFIHNFLNLNLCSSLEYHLEYVTKSSEGKHMSEIAPSIIQIKPYLTQGIVLSEALSIKQVVPSTHLLIPYALEKINAGFPSPAQDYVDKALDMNEHLIKNETATFIVKVASLSMLNAGIDIDDELIVDRSLDAKHGDIVIALIDNEFTVKRLMIDEKGQWLKAENPEYKNIYLQEGQELIIWGVVTHIIKMTRH